MEILKCSVIFDQFQRKNCMYCYYQAKSSLTALPILALKLPDECGLARNDLIRRVAFASTTSIVRHSTPNPILTHFKMLSKQSSRAAQVRHILKSYLPNWAGKRSSCTDT
jgi:hypothetical protein